MLKKRGIFFTVSSQLIIMIYVFTVFFGCGTMFDGKSNPSSKVIVPKEISIEIPNLLKVKDKKEKRVVSRGYEELKNILTLIDSEQQSLEISLLLLNQIMDKIVTKCEKTPLEKTCFLKEETILFVFDNKFLEGVREVLNSSLENFSLKDEEYYLGSIEFTRYDLNETYQYSVKMDTSTLSQIFDKEELSMEHISWSKDGTNVTSYSFSEYLNSSDINEIIINYQKNKNGSNEMLLTYTFDDKESDNKLKLSLELNEKNDFYKTLELSTDMNISSNTRRGEVEQSSMGILSDRGGFLSIVGKDDLYFFKEYYLFANEGKIISSKYCENNLICDFYNRDTWLDIDALTRTKTAQIWGKGGHIEEKVRYFFFKPLTDISSKVLITKENQNLLLDALIGEFYFFNNIITGMLFSDSYLNQLDKLVMTKLYIENNNTYLIPLLDQNKPTFYNDKELSFGYNPNY